MAADEVPSFPAALRPVNYMSKSQLVAQEELAAVRANIERSERLVRSLFGDEALLSLERLAVVRRDKPLREPPVVAALDDTIASTLGSFDGLIQGSSVKEVRDNKKALMAFYDEAVEDAARDTRAQQQKILSRGEIYRALRDLYGKVDATRSKELQQLTGALLEMYGTIAASEQLETEAIGQLVFTQRQTDALFYFRLYQLVVERFGNANTRDIETLMEQTKSTNPVTQTDAAADLKRVLADVVNFDGSSATMGFEPDLSGMNLQYLFYLFKQYLYLPVLDSIRDALAQRAPIEKAERLNPDFNDIYMPLPSSLGPSALGGKVPLQLPQPQQSEIFMVPGAIGISQHGEDLVDSPLVNSLLYASTTRDGIRWINTQALKIALVLELLYWRTVATTYKLSSHMRTAPTDIRLDAGKFSMFGTTVVYQQGDDADLASAAPIYVPIHAVYEPRDDAPVESWTIRVISHTPSNASHLLSETTLVVPPGKSRGQQLDLSITVQWPPECGTFEVMIIANSPDGRYDELYLPRFNVTVELPCIRCGQLFRVGLENQPNAIEDSKGAQDISHSFSVTSEPSLKRQRHNRSLAHSGSSCEWRFDLMQFRQRQSLGLVDRRAFSALVLVSEIGRAILQFMRNQVRILLTPIADKQRRLRTATAAEARILAQQITKDYALLNTQLTSLRREFRLDNIEDKDLGLDTNRADNVPHLVTTAEVGAVVAYWTDTGGLSYRELLELMSEIMTSHRYGFRFWPNRGPDELVFAGGMLDKIYPPQLVAEIPQRLLERLQQFEANGNSALMNPHKTAFAQQQAHLDFMGLGGAQPAPTLMELVRALGGGYQSVGGVGGEIRTNRTDLPSFMYDQQGEELLDTLIERVCTQKLDSSSVFSSVHSINNPLPEPYVFQPFWLMVNKAAATIEPIRLDASKMPSRRNILASFGLPANDARERAYNTSLLTTSPLFASEQTLGAYLAPLVTPVLADFALTAAALDSVPKFSPRLYASYWTVVRFTSNTQPGRSEPDAWLVLGFHLPLHTSHAGLASAVGARLQSKAMQAITSLVATSQRLGNNLRLFEDLISLFQSLNEMLLLGRNNI